MNILITGGTGSFGQAFVKAILPKYYERICIYSRDEHKQEKMQRELLNLYPKEAKDKLRFFIGDIRDKERLNLACKNINIIIHAAALKIVPAAEYNPFEAIKTNILGAQNLIDVCINNVNNSVYPKVIALSTDKAVHPINLYGATKLCAEKLFIAANNIVGPEHGPRFSVVRYGNVANSNGSVIPLFRSQIAKQEQLTITDDNMSRFWITLDEAVALVLKSLNVMYGGEVFVPDMPSFNVKELALAMMVQAKYPLENQWCRVIGPRPGEKLAEEIITSEELENTCYDKDNKFYVINASPYEKARGNYIFDLRGKNISSDSDFVERLTKDSLIKNLATIGAANDR